MSIHPVGQTQTPSENPLRIVSSVCILFWRWLIEYVEGHYRDYS
jgi:hypothetical protein